MKLSRKSQDKKDDKSVPTGGTIPIPAPNFLSAITGLQDAMFHITKLTSDMSRRELIHEAFSHWPHPFGVTDPKTMKTVYVESKSVKFTAKELWHLWDELNVNWWMESNFNETEKEDLDALHKHLFSLSDDTISIDVFYEMIQGYLDTRYPEPQMNPFISFNGFTMEEKHYFLPALKVLHEGPNGIFWSPVYNIPWDNNEAEAHHLDHAFIPNFAPSYVEHGLISGAMGRCDCGIYASVNLKELRAYFQVPEDRARGMGMDGSFKMSNRRLCIIEPFSDSTVWMARKGWKTDRAFISEIVGETMSIEDAATLLSMVWHRPIDVHYIFKETE